MRTNEQRIAQMHERALTIEHEDRERKTRILQIGSFAAALAVVVLIALMMPGVAKMSAQGTVPDGMVASIFSQNDKLGFIVVAILSFALGASVTIFCFYLRKYCGKED